MAVCLDYQSVHQRKGIVISVRAQMLAGLFLLLALGAKVWVKIEAVQIGYELADVRDRIVELDMKRREYELERSVLLRQDNLEGNARQQLGLSSMVTERARIVKRERGNRS